ncbi:uncharacterized protein CDAR_104951 [Caerostris darwini]|uniref:Uncharacterized protein n=1 Tax=Caerostris darwini TaxID=1538125 RepID=A0AAV4V5U5_9ARAC|nr:uncharacterized protein CDAR_104951 [Caerostris darwini]
MLKKCSRAAKKPPTLKQADNSAVWTLVPKEFVNSEYFKSHIIKMQSANPRGRRPKNNFMAPQNKLRMPFNNRENIEIKFPKASPRIKKPMINQDHQLAGSSRPTVIYFTPPKNVNPSEAETQPVLNQRKLSEHQKLGATSSKEQWDAIYLRKKYGSLLDEATFEYIYGVAHGDLHKAEDLIRDLISGRKQLINESNSRHTQNFCGKSQTSLSQAIATEPANDLQNFSKGYYDTESQCIQDYSYFSCRQVIVDSIRLLYDDESVLGYE